MESSSLLLFIVPSLIFRDLAITLRLVSDRSGSARLKSLLIVMFLQIAPYFFSEFRARPMQHHADDHLRGAHDPGNLTIVMAFVVAAARNISAAVAPPNARQPV